MSNKDSIEKLHGLMPKIYKTRVNPNWKAIIEAIGQNDQDLMDLIEAVRDQMFVATSSRPYLDRLAANVKVNRPRLTGMDDATFRKYIPVMAYQPKQVKPILDALLDIFFFKEATTAYIESTIYDSFYIVDAWELEYTVDGTNQEQIVFKASDFGSISAATPEEVVSAINRKAKYSFAILYDNRILKRKYVRIFTKTIGAKGSLQIIGGRANYSFRFPGWVDNAGSGASTVWTVTKIGDLVTFTHASGDNPNLQNVQVGDIAICNVPDNTGAFVIEGIDLVAGSFSFRNLLGTAGSYDHSALPGSFVRFQQNRKSVVYTVARRAVTWEVKPGEIIIEMPATPPVVRRQLKGSAHINGLSASVVQRTSTTSLELDNIDDWPSSGQFVLQAREGISHHILTISEDTTTTLETSSRYDKANLYEYTSKSGNVISGISPALPTQTGLYETSVVSFTRDAAHVAEITLSAPVSLEVGSDISIRDVTLSTGTVNINGTHIVTEVISPTQVRFIQAGDVATGTGGVLTIERSGMIDAASLVYLTTAQTDTGIYGPYVWDTGAAFVLSSLTGDLSVAISTGDNTRTVSVASGNNIPNEEGFIIFDYGTEYQEGPVRYFSRPNENTVQIDPSYTFMYDHAIGSSVTVIRRRGAHIMSGTGAELGFYITDPSIARTILQEQIELVKSVGIFMNFLIRYPEQLYASLDVYGTGDPSLWPIS